MNTEIFDYLKALSKKEFFIANALSVVLSVVIILAGIISLREGATLSLYTIMYGCATVVLGLNSYKCFKRGSKNGWVFAILCAILLGVTGIALYALFGGQ